MTNRNPGQEPDTSPQDKRTENSRVAALVEIGILCRGEDVEVRGDGAPDPGPHDYSGHNQFCRYEHPSYQYPYEDPSVPAFDFYPPDMTMDFALAKTRMLVMLGAADSPAFRRAMQEPDSLVFLFEPDDRVLVRFLESAGLARLNRQGFFLFTGNPYSFSPALQEMLPEDLFKKGTPAVFLTERIRSLYPEWAAAVTEYMEVLHYRHAIYPLTGQFMARSRPFRKISRNLIYDQQAHCFDNVGDHLRFPDISRIRNTMRGHSAILVAAGPDLENQLEFIRRNRSRALIISVNNALKPLVEAGIRPHLTVINDISMASGKVFEHIPPVPETILVGQCMSDLGGDKFRQKYLFGDHLPSIFGPRPSLELHGSVITAAFSLAVYLGCVRTVLVGAQLCSDNPWSLTYAKGTVKDRAEGKDRPLIHRFPQLYPVTMQCGDTAYTTINFRDAALWLAENIRLSGVECINTARHSILFGRGIEYDPEPELPEAEVNRQFASLFKPDPFRPDFMGAADYVRYETDRWTNIARTSAELLKAQGPIFVGKGVAVLEHMDKHNVTCLVERFGTFRNDQFMKMLNRRSAREQEAALRYYYEHVLEMSRDLLRRLSKAEIDCRRAARDAGVELPPARR